MSAVARSSADQRPDRDCPDDAPRLPDPPAAPRWFDDDEQQAWRSYLRGAALLIDSLERDLQAYRVSLSEYEILALVSEAPGRRLRMSVLADAVVQSRSRLTHTATRLERRGWVRRQQSETDRRGVELCLTEVGFDVLVRLAPVHLEGVRRVVREPLGRERFLRLGEYMRVVGLAAQGTAPDCPGDGPDAAQDGGPDGGTAPEPAQPTVSRVAATDGVTRAGVKRTHRRAR